jgi:hypothetical protein
MNRKIGAKEIAVPAGIAIPAPKTAGGFPGGRIRRQRTGDFFKPGCSLIGRLNQRLLSCGGFEICQVDLLDGNFRNCVIAIRLALLSEPQIGI